MPIQGMFHLPGNAPQLGVEYQLGYDNYEVRVNTDATTYATDADGVGVTVKEAKKQKNDPLRFGADRFFSYLVVPYRADVPSAPSMRSRRLYLATRSLLQGAPDLRKLALTATARSESVVSSVSPER